MKKVSTVGAKQSENFYQPTLAIGLDLAPSRNLQSRDDTPTLRNAFSRRGMRRGEPHVLLGSQTMSPGIVRSPTLISLSLFFSDFPRHRTLAPSRAQGPRQTLIPSTISECSQSRATLMERCYLEVLHWAIGPSDLIFRLQLPPEFWVVMSTPF